MGVDLSSQPQLVSYLCYVLHGGFCAISETLSDPSPELLPAACHCRVCSFLVLSTSKLGSLEVRCSSLYPSQPQQPVECLGQNGHCDGEFHVE